VQCLNSKNGFPSPVYNRLTAENKAYWSSILEYADESSTMFLLLGNFVAIETNCCNETKEGKRQTKGTFLHFLQIPHHCLFLISI
jgi:hypothetical protein